MKRGKLIIILLVIAVFFSLLSIVISISVDSSSDLQDNYNSESISYSKSGKVGLEVLDFEDVSDKSMGVENEN